MFAEGYKYWLSYKKNNISYYRCSLYKDKCTGRCAVTDTGIVRVTVDHNHEPEPDRVSIDKFRKALTHRAATETTSLHTIYWDEATQRHSEAAMLYTFEMAESTMRKAQKKQLPPIPKTITDLNNVLTNKDMFRIKSCGQQKDPFFQSILELSDNVTCLIFAHIRTLQKIGRIEEIHFDASIEISKPPSELVRSSSSSSSSSQSQSQTRSQSQSQSSSTVQCANFHILTLHSVKSYDSIPMFYIIMTERSQTIFSSVFAYIREHFNEYVSPSICITNFNTDIQSALSLTFPEATIKGFWFHYADSVMKNITEMELKRNTSRGHGASFLRMLLVLPLLPADYMVPGLQALQKWANEKKILTTNMNILCKNIERYWLKSAGVDKMSIFGLPHNIYNPIQLFNKNLKNALKSEFPTLWQMLEAMTFIATKTYSRLNRTSNQTQTNKSDKIRGTIIKDATHLWIRTQVHLRSPLYFLQITSHSINDTLAYDNCNGGKVVDDAISMALPIKITNFYNVEPICTPLNDSIPSNLITQSSTTDSDINYDQQQQQQPQQPSSSHTTLTNNESQKEQPNSSDPPPLAFFPKVKIVQRKQKNTNYSSTEPPPLVPIKNTPAHIPNHIIKNIV